MRETKANKEETWKEGRQCKKQKKEKKKIQTYKTRMLGEKKTNQKSALGNEK